MRYLTLVMLLVAFAATAAAADDARTTIGDIPRTFSHYLNAQEAALCKANAATGGVASYFWNPAAVSEVTEIAGQATMRFNSKSRDYLPQGDEHLEATDDHFLFTQFVAVKTSGPRTLGFGYSNPSYRNVVISGVRDYDGDLREYEGEFKGAYRCFEVIGATRIGVGGQGAIGVSAGIANLSEEAHERVVGQALETARIDGIAASYAAGFSFDATSRVTLGLGYRWSTTVGVSGEYYKQTQEGESTTEPVTVAGLRIRPTDFITLHIGYVQDGWDRAKSTLAAYPRDEGGLDWKQFTEPVTTLAVGAEVDVAGGRGVVRAGYSRELGADIDNAIVPENSIGFGGSIRFRQYVADIALVREQFMEGGESGQVTNYGFYLTAG
jgi:hypothetical protein